MRETYTISKAAASLAVKLLREHSSTLVNLKLPASAELAGTIADQIAGEIALQGPQTVDQQIKALTDIMGVGPEDEAVGNKV